MSRYYYRAPLLEFLVEDPTKVFGVLAENNEFDLVEGQRLAWTTEIRVLQEALKGFKGTVYFEYSIPRMGRRIDVVLIIGGVILALEFKVGEDKYKAGDIDQVFDYALDLKNFHETSAAPALAPILVASYAPDPDDAPAMTPHKDNLFSPIRTNSVSLRKAISKVLATDSGPAIDSRNWEEGRYRPTPTIVEAAMALYSGHSVKDLSRSDAGAINLTLTSEAINKIIQESKEKSRKSIVFVTGVPGAGKTLVGLNTATSHFEKQSELYSVFLSGNGPLVAILREALTRDRVRFERENGKKVTKGSVLSEVKVFVQNVHNFRDDLIASKTRPPIEHVTIFDEAQRAWTLEQTRNFMKRRKGLPNFNISEPEFLISCLDRHQDWAVIVCLVGGGQEINTGEAGIGEWIESLERSYKDWKIYISSRLSDSEYGAGMYVRQLEERKGVEIKDELHLSVSMRSFRAENVSLLVKQLLDLEEEQAGATLRQLNQSYPIVLTRSLPRAKTWLKKMARGSERYGIVVSSQAERLRPHGVFVKSPMDPVLWFLNGKEDVRSSYFLEDVATEFDVQGLELDWVGVTWDADFRYSPKGWLHRSFVGERWNNINKPESQIYQKNAYRVLLTRARQGMIVVVPEGDPSDSTRASEFYDPTFQYLEKIGFQVV